MRNTATLLFALGMCAPLAADPCVVLLHGLARTERSMKALEARLVNEGYGVVNIGYPSRTAVVSSLSELQCNRSANAARASGDQGGEAL